MFWLKKGKFFILCLLVLFSLPTILPLFQPGFFPSDDGEWMIIRFSAFHQALVDGQFPVRFLSRLNNEYGYPVANFLYPGFMYLSEIPKVLGFGFVDSIKIILGLSMILSSVFTYLWLSKIFDKWPAFIGSLFYLYTPYHLFDLYKRGSVGEVLALSIAPFVLWQIERKSFFWTTIGVAFLIISHNTLALLLLPIIVLYGLVRNLSSIIYHLSSIILGLGFSAFFWIPAIFDLQYTRFFQTPVSNWQDHFADIGLVGFSTFAILVLGMLLLLFHSDTRKYRSMTILFLFIGFLSTILSLSISSPVWQFLPASIVQFPFRFLSVSLTASAFLSAFIINQLRVNMKIITLIALLVLLAFSVAPFARPTIQFDKGDSYYATNEDTTTVRNEYMPRWVRTIPTERPKELVEFIEEEGRITDVVVDGRRVGFVVAMESEGLVQVNKVFFPGWRALVNGEEVHISYENEKGIMEIPVPAGKSQILATFGETTVRVISDIISLGSLGLLGVFVFKKR